MKKEPHFAPFTHSLVFTAMSLILLFYLVVLPVNVGLVSEGDGQGEAGEEHQEPQQAVA